MPQPPPASEFPSMRLAGPRRVARSCDCARRTRGLMIAWQEWFLRAVQRVATQGWIGWMGLSSCFYYVGRHHDDLLSRFERHGEIIWRGDEPVADIHVYFLAHVALRVA